ncbi:MAG: AAA family ATPase [Myxococcales bacterium]|nr:AAA family ATPase [Myxococcales bacterium]MCB9719156.1 AAA family ATPase [Myxococcales bacterium]
MIALHALRVENFRSLAKVDVPLRALNVLVGANASGKSNLLEVIGFLGDVARQDLLPAIDSHGGWDSLLFRGGSTKRASIRIEVEAQVTRHSSERAHDHYVLLITSRGRARVRREEFKFKRTPGRGRRITVDGARVEIDDERASKRNRALAKQSAGLATLQKLGPDEGALQVGELADLFESFRVFDPDVQAARLPSPTPSSASLAADASNLAAFLRWLHDEHDETFELLVDDLRAVVPGLSNIHFEAIGGSAEGVRLTIEESTLRGRTELAHASFGTVRALALLAMLHDPNPPRLSCVEEVDHGLHPYALDRIVERLRSASERTQLLLATHSPTLVNRLAPEELIICERDPDTGASLIPAIDPSEVRSIAAEDELGLGELWFTGTLGGVPP